MPSVKELSNFKKKWKWQKGQTVNVKLSLITWWVSGRQLFDSGSVVGQCVRMRVFGPVPASSEELCLYILLCPPTPSSVTQSLKEAMQTHPAAVLWIQTTEPSLFPDVFLSEAQLHFCFQLLGIRVQVNFCVLDLRFSYHGLCGIVWVINHVSINTVRTDDLSEQVQNSVWLCSPLFLSLCVMSEQ